MTQEEQEGTYVERSVRKGQSEQSSLGPIEGREGREAGKRHAHPVHWDLRSFLG